MGLEFHKCFDVAQCRGGYLGTFGMILAADELRVYKCLLALVLTSSILNQRGISIATLIVTGKCN
jgi:hypothetical protein